VDFYTWLCAQAERIDHVGIIAGIAKQDKSFPRRQRKLYIFLKHYDKNSRLSAEQRDNCRRAIKIAHAEWRALRDTRAVADASEEHAAC
jgi:uncharacterized protein YozE (UPF0346 family)